MERFNTQSLSDLELVENIKGDKNCFLSYQELLSRHTGLYSDVVQSVASNLSGSLKNDLYEDSSYVLNLAVQSYQNDKGAKFSTWFSRQARWHCLETIKKNKNDLYCRSVACESDASDLENNSVRDYFNAESEKELLSLIEDQLDPRSAEIVKMHMQGFSIKDIAKKMNLHKTYCSYLFCLAKKPIREALLKREREL